MLLIQIKNLKKNIRQQQVALNNLNKVIAIKTLKVVAKIVMTLLSKIFKL